MKKTIVTDNAPKAIGPYSQGIVIRGTLYSSGQIPINPVTGEIEGSDITEQTYTVMKNLSGVLSAAEMTFADVVKATCYLKNMSDFAEFNKVYGEFFVSKPARSCVSVAALPKDVLVEIDIVAAHADFIE